MTDAQVITLAVAILGVFAGTIFNNPRIRDLDCSVSRHIDDKFALLASRSNHGRHIMGIIGHHETRIHKPEHSMNASQEPGFALL